MPRRRGNFHSDRLLLCPKTPKLAVPDVAGRGQSCLSPLSMDARFFIPTALLLCPKTHETAPSATPTRGQRCSLSE